MSDVFLDTVGLIALWDETDQWQQAATDAMAALNVPGTRFVTSTYILLECGNAAARSLIARMSVSCAIGWSVRDV